MEYALSYMDVPEMWYNRKKIEQADVMDNDLPLVHAFKNGDQSAFEELVRKYKDRVCRIAYAMLQDRHEADDVAQEVFLKVYGRIDTFREDASFFTWLYSIAVNECRHSMRKRKKATVSLDAAFSENGVRLADLLRSSDRSPESQLINKEQAALARRIIGLLPEQYRIAYTLRIMDGLSYKEIAKAMDTTVDKVKVLLFRAREKLDEQLRPFYETYSEER